MVAIEPLFKLKGASLFYFKTILDALENIMKDSAIQLIVSSEILYLFGKNDLEIGVKISLPKTFFEEYTVQTAFSCSILVKYIAKIFQRPTTKESFVQIAHLQERNQLSIIFVDSTIQESSNFEIPKMSYSKEFESLFQIDADEFYQTTINLKPGKYMLQTLFGDQKHIDFEKDICFELWTKPIEEFIRVITVYDETGINILTYPKAQTLIHGPLVLTNILSIEGSESQEIYDYELIRGLSKLDSLVAQIKIFYHQKYYLRIQYQFFQLENCFFTLFAFPVVFPEPD